MTAEQQRLSQARTGVPASKDAEAVARKIGVSAKAIEPKSDD